MCFVFFFVMNFWSIIDVYKIFIGDFIVLIGCNNEGKLNLLRVFNFVMRVFIVYVDEDGVSWYDN